MTGEHIRGIPRTYEKEITLADTPYTLSVGFNCVKVDTTGGNVLVNLPNVNYPIDVIKTSSDSYIVTIWVGGVQKATVAGPLSKITIENAEVTKDEPWFPYDAIVGIAGVSGDGGEVLAKDRYGRVIAGGRGVAGTDDVIVIQTALTTVKASTGILYIKRNSISNYTITPGIGLDINGMESVRITGDMPVIEFDKNNAQSMLGGYVSDASAYDNIVDCEIDHLVLKTPYIGLIALGCKNLHVHHLHVLNAKIHGINLAGDGVLADHNYVDGVDDAFGMLTSHGACNIQFIHNIIKNVATDGGLEIGYGCHDIRFAYNHIENCRNGIQIMPHEVVEVGALPNWSFCNDVQVDHNTIKNTTKYGIYYYPDGDFISQMERIDISYNDINGISGTTGTGIFVNNKGVIPTYTDLAKSLRINNNTIENMGQLTYPAPDNCDIYINNTITSDYIELKNNTLKKCGMFHIYNGSPNAVIEGNSIIGSSASYNYGIYSLGANAWVVQNYFYNSRVSFHASSIGGIVKRNRFNAMTSPAVVGVASISENVNFIVPGESRSISGTLTAGNADAIAFAWHNPELQDILIKKVTIRITTPGGTAGSLLDVGIADDAAGTNLGAEFFDDLDLNTAGTSDQDITAVFCQDRVSATDGWVVGKILVQNAASLVGSYYIEYMGA